MSWRMKQANGDICTEANTGFAAYIGRKRVGWALDLAETIQQAIEAIKHQPTHKRFVPSVTIFDCAQILNVAFVTDDANGIVVHQRSPMKGDF